MKKYNLSKNITTVMLAWAMLIMPLATFGQTRISMPRNKYKVQDDIRIGREASAQVEQQMPILNDSETTRYVQDVGRRLVNAIPSQFQQPGFQYSFQVVNARDINAFALPGGPMYVNRGMIEAAKSEGEMAGVMAHEIAHIALRHGTSQATKQSNPLNQIGTIGLILGGAILGGEQGAQLGAVGAQAIMTKYSRDYESKADILGAQIMANAGYDPRDLANMFRTIERESGGSRAPEWLSSHPNPGNRYEAINREAQMLRVNNPTQNTAQFERIQSKLRRLPRAQSMQEISRNTQGNGQGRTENPTANGRYESRVELPSARTRSYTAGNFLRLNVPDNWQVFETQESVTFSPQGGYGKDGITHGAMVGLIQTRNRDLGQATEEYVNGLLQEQSNSYLRQQSNYAQTTIARRNAYTTVLSGRSPITGRTEIVNIFTTQLSNGGLLYVAMVAPQNESSSYDNAFRNIIRSIQING
ncbi:MAG TPA: M48 family metalloprotease [Pyrinomonadaceae bacterium]|nr:M48 family metalloprotease [Pyrinomonadaceae bacterium]